MKIKSFSSLFPTDYLAAIPQQTICRHKELLLNGELTGVSRTRRTSAMFKNCNGTIKEASEGESSNMESVEDDEELLDEFDHDKPIGNFKRNLPIKIRTNSCKILIIFLGEFLFRMILT